jgi:predicted GNAT family acetyltransferase
MPDDAMAKSQLPPLPGIVHDQAARRFIIVVDGVEAELEYLLGEHAITITHTGVPPAIGGRGVAGALVHAAVEFARGAGLKVVPACSYAEAWMRRHREYADLRA